MIKKRITVALVGNPNAGKSTIFNNLTGARQHVGNYPGVTVEKKEGLFNVDGTEIIVVDLPGTYSLTAYSVDERIARSYIIDRKPDVVVDVIDSSNLERNLYLTMQLLELNVPMVLLFNMIDVAKSRGIRFDQAVLSEAMGAPIVMTVGNRGIGTRDIIGTVIKMAEGGFKHKTIKIDYGIEIEKEIEGLQRIIGDNGFARNLYDPRWIAIKLLENDPEVLDKIESDVLKSTLRDIESRLEEQSGELPETLIAERRYRFITEICDRAGQLTDDGKRTATDKIDTIMTDRIFGLPIFLGMMYLVFQLTFTVGDPLVGFIESFFGWSGGVVTGWWQPGVESPLKSLLVDGIIGGVGGVIVFLPNILLLFLAIAFLEDSGYMPRAAFIMDRLMYKLGLHGKSFIPMLIGFGCSVPAIMATRTLDNRRDRLITMLVTPLMSCGARLPIYSLIIPAFFPMKLHGTILFLIYLIGIMLAIVSAKVLRLTVFKGPSAPFVMELPPYRLPTLKSTLIHMWERGRLYLKKAGTIIFGVSIVLWALTSYPKKEVITASDPEVVQAEEMSYSFAGRIGRVMEPVIKPLGFDWKIGTAMVGAFAAKEVFVAQMGIVYAVRDPELESGTLREKLGKTYSPLTGFCIMLFMLISAPCMATVAITRRESNSWKWALFQFGGLTIMAYVLTLIVYQVGSAFGIGAG